eukprot:TRINITY_DN1746_c0_g1_i1.p1 TRINITY_DN1746_c0_g1~~TRINITY_DN1746_c0_g1_i1.p1  ORF type:complete len:401 (+),score=80.30 TRINITY_DN1746_c0_g1_i1:141-1343(+)
MCIRDRVSTQSTWDIKPKQMKYILFITLLGLITCSPDFSKLENSEFGKSLLDTVQVQLSSSANIDALMQLLDKLRDEMNAQKETQEHDHQAFQTDCAKDIDFYEQEIASATVKVVDTDREIQITTENLKIKDSLLEQLNQQYGVYSATRDKILESRQAEAAEYQRKNGEHDQTVTAIEEAKQFFVKIKNELVAKQEQTTSFLQEKSFEKERVKSQLADVFAYGKSQITNPKYQAILTVLSSVSQQEETSPEVIAKLLELCNRVLQNIQDSRMAETAAENKRIEIFTNKMKMLDESLSKTKTKITAFETEKNALDESKKMNEGIKEEQVERRDQNKKLMQNRIEECKVETKNYEELRSKSLEQIRTVEMVITSVQTNLAVMKSYLRERRAETGNKLDLNIH